MDGVVQHLLVEGGLDEAVLREQGLAAEGLGGDGHAPVVACAGEVFAVDLRVGELLSDQASDGVGLHHTSVGVLGAIRWTYGVHFPEEDL